MKLKANFNTLSGPTEVVFTAEELKGTDLGRIYLRLLELRAEGVVGGVYDLPLYGRVELNLVEEDEHDGDFDPTPYCAACGAMRKSACACGPIADNE